MTQRTYTKKLLDSVMVAKHLVSLANELENKTSKKKTSNPIYVGIFVDPVKLKSMVTPLYTAENGGKAPADHVTLQYKPTLEQQQKYEPLIGQMVPITITSVSYNADIQAVSVSLPEGVECSNVHPHITISHLSTVSAQESKTLLDKASKGDETVQTETFNPPMTIMGVIDFFPRTIKNS